MGLIEKYKVYKAIEQYVTKNPYAVSQDVRSVTEWTWRGISGYTEYTVNKRPSGTGIVAQVCREIRRNGNDVYCLYTMCPVKRYYGRFAHRVFQMIERKYNECKR